MVKHRVSTHHNLHVAVPLPKPILWAKWLAHWMDNAFELPFLKWRFGFDAVVGLLPIGGDVITSIFAFSVVGLALYYKMPWAVVGAMVANIAVDFLIGLVPILGDVADFRVKAYTRNANLLVTHYERLQPASSATITTTSTSSS